jgi:uroporphyrinogen-III synthase
MSQTSILSTKTLSVEQRQVFIDADFDLLEQDFIEIKITFWIR